jgi:hypothetical protein
MRRMKLVEPPQQRLQQTRAIRIGVGDDDRKIDRRQDRVRLAGKVDRARAVQHDILVAEILEPGHVEFCRKPSRPRLLAAIADRGSRRNRSFSLNGAGCVEHRFEQARLAGAAGSAKGDRTHGRRLSSAHVSVLHDLG